MIVHQEDTSHARFRPSAKRPEHAWTLCGRWVETFRLAPRGPDAPDTPCQRCTDAQEATP